MLLWKQALEWTETYAAPAGPKSFVASPMLRQVFARSAVILFWGRWICVPIAADSRGRLHASKDSFPIEVLPVIYFELTRDAIDRAWLAVGHGFPSPDLLQRHLWSLCRAILNIS
jgi:hypothetical protein